MTSQTKEKSDPQLTEEPSAEKRLPARKKFKATIIQTDTFYSRILHILSKHCFVKLSLSFYVAVNFIISRTIQLLKQTWFPLARRGSQIEGFIAN